MTKPNPLTGEDPRLKKASEHLWHVADLVAAGQVILGHALVNLEGNPAIKGLDGILSAIGTLADLANCEVIEAKDEPMQFTPEWAATKVTHA